MTPLDLTERVLARWELADLAERNGWTVNLPLPGPQWVHCILHRGGVRLEVEWADDLPTGCQVTIADPAHRTVTIPVCPHRSAQRWAAAYDPWRAAHTTLERLAETIDLDTIDLRGLQ